MDKLPTRKFGAEGGNLDPYTIAKLSPLSRYWIPRLLSNADYRKRSQYPRFFHNVSETH